MGERGPLKLPRHLQPVDKGAVESLADSVKPGAPELPHGFSNDPDLRALWDEMVPLLDDAGLMARTDGPTIELALRHFLAARKASDELLISDAAVPDRHETGAMKKNPADAVFRAQSAMFLEYVKLLGMAFAARARIPGRKDDDNGEENVFAATG